jgi:hypothetical protein
MGKRVKPGRNSTPSPLTIPAEAVEQQVFIPFASLALDQGAGFFKIMDGLVAQLRSELPAAAA